MAWKRPAWVLRLGALLIVLAGVPAALSVSAFLEDTPIREGEASPRTVVAPDTITVSDEESTERARREAADSVPTAYADDEEARVAVVNAVRDAFARIAAVRTPGMEEGAPTRTEQIEALRERMPVDEEGLRLATGLSDAQLSSVAQTAEMVAFELVRDPIRESNLEDVRTRRLQREINLRSFPPGVGERVVQPIIADALRPTVREDVAATEAERQRAADSVQPVTYRFTRGAVIVSAGEEVSPVQMEALRMRGLEGSEPWRFTARVLALTLVLVAAVASYLRAYRQRVWASTRRIVLLSLLLLLFAVALEMVTMLAPSSSSVWLFVLPAGALAMLATILFDPPIGVLATIPVTALVAFAVPGEPALVVFVAIASLASVPLVSRLSARGDLRRGLLRAAVAYTVLAPVCAVAFGSIDAALPALGAGAINGVLTAVIVMGSLPFLESLFGIVTATSLLDLADRNHPLLRELEQKALGSYNHSIMVSTMVERACRAIGANGLLGSVAALYHDIGKVRRPYFFVENQFAIANPHDELEPRVSAVIIQEHVTDGIEMARSFRLPPEVVEGIATHHGTTLVTYFYRQAVKEAGDDGHVDESHYRYKGRKPASKEMAILMLADCCEGASRAAAQSNRNLSKSELEDIVHGLVADRVEDGQLDEANLTFRELKSVQESFIETLVGVYHPRIAYPSDPKKEAAAVATASPAALPGGRAPQAGDGNGRGAVAEQDGLGDGAHAVDGNGAADGSTAEDEARAQR